MESYESISYINAITNIAITFFNAVILFRIGKTIMDNFTDGENIKKRIINQVKALVIVNSILALKLILEKYFT